MIHDSDISILVKVFFPGASRQLVYHPQAGAEAAEGVFTERSSLLQALLQRASDTVVIDLSREPASWPNCRGVLCLHPQAGARMFAYLNNADGSIRWLYPQGQKTPYFLALYNASGWRSGLIQFLFRAAYSLGLGKRVAHGHIGVIMEERPTWLATGEAQSQQLALFTGTKGENRKAVVAWGPTQREVAGFAKIPLTEAATQLVQNEARCLAQLALTSHPQLVVPSAQLAGESLLMSNVKPARSRSFSVLKDIHLQALSSWYAAGTQPSGLSALPAWQALGTTLADIPTWPGHPNIAPQRLQKMQAHLQSLYTSLSQQPGPWPVAVAHGDFTPWNMFVTPQALHVYDWELSALQVLGYDAFHFVLQSNIFIHRRPAKDIQQQVDALIQHPLMQQLAEAHQLDLRAAWHYYLCVHITYYLLRYLRQADWHAQVHWQLDTWEALLYLQHP